jgi:CRP-like cAMP-binding protein
VKRIEPANPPQNRLLASLSASDYQRLLAYLEPVQLDYRQVLYQANRPIQFLYFFETGVGSLVHTMKNGHASEIGTIGNEGVVGLPVIFGDKQAPNSIYVQVPGSGLRMKSERIAEVIEQNLTLKTSLLHYAHAFFNQVAQSAACVHYHSLEQRCCRWLLMTYDRMGSNEFLLTQEFLAMMLGVRRAGVTVAAGELQRAGLIRYRRGTITILDIEGLKRRSCECYEISKREFDRLLGSTSIPALPSRSAVRSHAQGPLNSIEPFRS